MSIPRSEVHSLSTPYPYNPLILSLFAVVLAATSLGLQFFPDLLPQLKDQSEPNRATASLVNTDNPRRLASKGVSPFSHLTADVAETLAPSVVNIDVRIRQKEENDATSEMFRYFFGKDAAPPSPQEQASQGSGIIYDAKKGYIITNNHVVQGASQMIVTLDDGKAYPAKRVGNDPLTDLAVIQIQAPSASLKAAPLGVSNQLRTGDWVLAMGSPLGFDHTVTLGIISALARKVPGLNEEVPFVQTDAAINPGNSGGPLVNLEGEVIGINTAIAGHGQNIGFSIPSDTVKTVADQLIQSGHIKRPYVGLALGDLNPEIATQLNLFPATKGVVVIQVQAHSPAESAGLEEGDVIQSVNGVTTHTAKAFQNEIRQKQIGTRFQLDVLRDKKRVQLSLRSQEMQAQAFQP
jgi:S1-C subfamily serine protease